MADAPLEDQDLLAYIERRGRAEKRGELRTYEHLEGLTEEERRLRKNKQNRESKQRQMRQQQQQPQPQPTDMRGQIAPGTDVTSASTAGAAGTTGTTVSGTSHSSGTVGTDDGASQALRSSRSSDMDHGTNEVIGTSHSLDTDDGTSPTVGAAGMACTAGTGDGAAADENFGNLDTDTTFFGTPDQSMTELDPSVFAHIQQLNKDQIEYFDAAQEKEMKLTKQFWEEEDSRVRTIVRDSQNNRIAHFQTHMDKRKAERTELFQSQRKFLTQQVERYSAAKAKMNTDDKVRRQRLKDSQHVPLADTLLGDTVVSSPDAMDNVGVETEGAPESVHKEALPPFRSNGRDKNGRLMVTVSSPTARKDNKGNNGNNGKDRVQGIADTDTETETEAIVESEDNGITEVSVTLFDENLSPQQAPLIKSALKTPVPKPTFVERIFGSSQKKKKRASFGKNQVRIYTPPTSDEKKAMHGATDTEKFLVVVTDRPVYKAWRRYHDGQFIKNFADSFDSLMGDPDAGLQVLYAAWVMTLLNSLDVGMVRKLARACFPRRRFPRLSDKQGRCNKAMFLSCLEKRLRDHAEEVMEHVPEENGPKVLRDWVTQTERNIKHDELLHIQNLASP